MLAVRAHCETLKHHPRYYPRRPRRTRSGLVYCTAWHVREGYISGPAYGFATLVFAKGSCKVDDFDDNGEFESVAVADDDGRCDGEVRLSMAQGADIYCDVFRSRCTQR